VLGNSAEAKGFCLLWMCVVYKVFMISWRSTC